MGGIAFERFQDSCAHAASGASGSAYSLELCTLDHRLPSWALTVLEFPSGAVEARAIWCPPRRGLTSSSSASEVAGPGGDSSPDPFSSERALRSVMRARRSMRHRILALGADRMLTLTKRGKFPDLDSAWAAFRAFSRICTRFYGSRWSYVCVPELHADGTYHFHLAIKGFYSAGLLRRFWFRALGGRGNERGEQTPGNIDLSVPRKRRGGPIRCLARYMGKYMGKDLSACVGGRRSYACSAGLCPSRTTRMRVPLSLGGTSAYAILSVLRALYPRLRFSARDWNVGVVSGVTVWSDA